jgi:hypothetical protein
MDRGDPRMNMAVEVRRHNPSLSLYQCLTISGFVYSRDIGNEVDHANVTLSQRKNQLNRRLRRAQNKSRDNHNIMTSGKRKEASKPEPESANSSSSSLVLMNITASKGTLSGEPNANFDDQCASRKKKRMVRSVLESTFAVTRKVPAADLASNFSYCDTKCSSATRQNQDQRDDYQYENATINDLLGGRISVTGNLTTSEDGTKAFAPLPEISYSLFDDKANDTPPSFSFPLSLDDSHGLDATLTPNLPDESNASASTTNNTPSATSTNNSTDLSAVVDPRQELALGYFVREPHALYQRCMLSAGFSREESNDMSSDSYRKFAFQAWKVECERLQALFARYDT